MGFTSDDPAAGQFGGYEIPDPKSKKRKKRTPTNNAMQTAHPVTRLFIFQQRPCTINGT